MKVAHCHAHQERIRSSDVFFLLFSRWGECIWGETMRAITIIELEIFNLSVSTKENRTISCSGNRHPSFVLGFWRLNSVRSSLLSTISGRIFMIQASSAESGRHLSDGGIIVSERIFWVRNQMNYLLFYAKHLSMRNSHRASLCNLSSLWEIRHGRYR